MMHDKETIRRILSGYPIRAKQFQKRADEAEREGDLKRARVLRAMANQILTNFKAGHL